MTRGRRPPSISQQKFADLELRRSSANNASRSTFFAVVVGVVADDDDVFVDRHMLPSSRCAEGYPY